MTGVVPISPKQESAIYNGQRYLLRFDPNAPPDERWVWQVYFQITYPHVGSSPSIDHARNSARRRIRRLQGEHERWGE